MTAPPGDEDAAGPVILCYDGSDAAKRAIRQGAGIVAGRSAIVLTVWESVGSSVLRHKFPEGSALGEDMKEISEAVVGELDEGTARRARATAEEGAAQARAAGFDAQPVASRAVARMAERGTATVWHAVLDIAEERGAAVIVLGARGRSSLGTALLGSVSYGVVHNSHRPVLVIPPAG